MLVSFAQQRIDNQQSNDDQPGNFHWHQQLRSSRNHRSRTQLLQIANMAHVKQCTLFNVFMVVRRC
jgi:hypothetical protein